MNTCTLDNLKIANTNTTRNPRTTSICFSVVTVNDKHRKPEFKIKRRG